MNAAHAIRENILALLDARGLTRADLAMWMRHERAWVSKVLRGQRDLQLRDLDRLADFLGVQAYQLFVPGIAAITERRCGRDRRSARERRQTPAVRIARDVLSPRTSLHADHPLHAQIASELAHILELQDEAARERATGTQQTFPPASRRRGHMGTANRHSTKG